VRTVAGACPSAGLVWEERAGRCTKIQARAQAELLGYDILEANFGRATLLSNCPSFRMRRDPLTTEVSTFQIRLPLPQHRTVTST